MKITIVTINYNNLCGLKETVQSVLTQNDYNLIEYIIIDGGSTDGSKDYLETLPNTIKWISEKDNGISDAFNKGIQLSTGDTVLFLNSGDCFIHDMVISRVVKDWVDSPVDILSYKVRVSKTVFIPNTDNQDEIYNSCTEPHQGTFVSKKMYQILGGYSEEYKIRMDYHFFARCKSFGASFKYINEQIVKYEEGGVSMKKENRIRFWKEGMAVKLKYGLKVGLKDLVKFVVYCKPF